MWLMWEHIPMASSKGIQVYDVDVENGNLIQRRKRSEGQQCITYSSVQEWQVSCIPSRMKALRCSQRDKNGDLTRINSVEYRRNERMFPCNGRRRQIPVCGRIS